MKSEVKMEQEMVWHDALVNQRTEKSQKNILSKSCAVNDDHLIAGAKRGNLAAFNRLVRSYQDDVYHWVLSLVRDEALADDITQLTFVAAYEKLHTFRGGSLKAWLFRIAHNRSIDEMRSEKRYPALSLDRSTEDEELYSLFSVLSSDEPTPEEALIQAERSGWLLKLVENLPEPFRQTLALVDLYDMDYREAAEVLGLPPGTVKSRVSRARVKLRESVAHHRNLW
jgi:RNA polymerase sigma-70 factor, ECF subfamily